MSKKDDIEQERKGAVEIQHIGPSEQHAGREEQTLREEGDRILETPSGNKRQSGAANPSEQPLRDALQLIKDKASEEDPKLTSAVTLRTILGGDFLTADMVRRQIWLFVLMVVFTVFYVAFRYQCQQDLIAIDKLENEVLDAKYKALSSSSTLTEKCRESHVLEALKQNRDSLLHVADQPPYIVDVER